MNSAMMPVPDGLTGIAQIVATVNQLKTYFGRLPAMRAAAVRIIGAAGNHDQAAQVSALAAFVRGAMVYVCDPVNAEFVQTPDVLLVHISTTGQAHGDCDDHALLFASLCEAIGIRCEIVGVASAEGGPLDHVICVAYLDAGPLEFDLVAKGFDQPSYAEKLFAGS